MRTLHDNIFKSLLDGVLYILLYILIPTTQCIIYTIKDKTDFFFCAFLLLSGLLYDCYTRYTSDMNEWQKKKMKWNAVSSGTSWMLSVVIYMLRNAPFDMPNWIVFLYVPSVLIAAFIAIFDVFAHIQCEFSN